MKKRIIDYLELEAFRGDTSIFLKEEHGQLTGGQFFDRVMQIGWWLHESGYWNEPIGVVASHTSETLCLYLGILASGNYYVPLQPETQPEKFSAIVQKTSLRLVFTDQSARWEELAADEQVTAAGTKDLQDAPGHAEAVLHGCRERLPQDARMYVIFTSGSTGEPKGIVKSQPAMIAFLESYIAQFGFVRTDRLANQTPFYFDASAKDIFLAMKIKCQLHILDERLFVAPLRLAQYLNEQEITVIQWVPSALCMLSRFRVFDQIKLHALRKVLFVGEVMPPAQLRIWMDALPDVQFFNLYGASEVAGVCMSYPVRELPEETDALPIGYPMPGCEVYLVQERALLTEAGKLGEIYVRSETLALGYLGDAARTAEVFVQRPCDQLPEGRYYKSGDLATYRADGALVFVSRGDFQIKHMGHRIELGEIEGALLGMNGIGGCCCLYEKQKLILCYEGTPEKKEVSRYLKEKLASYMLPNKIVAVERLPRNAHGKTDRKQLSAMLKKEKGR